MSRSVIVTVPAGRFLFCSIKKCSICRDIIIYKRSCLSLDSAEVFFAEFLVAKLTLCPEWICSIPNVEWVNGKPEIESWRSIDLTEKAFAFSGVEIIVFLSGSEIWSLAAVNGMETGCHQQEIRVLMQWGNVVRNSRVEGMQCHCPEES